MGDTYSCIKFPTLCTVPQLPGFQVVAVLMLAGLLLAGFFFGTTRAALLLRRWRQRGGPLSAPARVYPIYTEPWLIRLVDHQPLISAILLCRYRPLVDFIVQGLTQQRLAGRRVLVTACAFGNVVPRVGAAAAAGGATQLQILDLFASELQRVRRKLVRTMPGPVTEFLQADACASPLPDGSVAANVMFFLLHELPPAQQQKALSEACRVLEPGGRLYLADFHRPRTWWMRSASWLYFKVFEPWGLALWAAGDPVRWLAGRPGMRILATLRLCAGNYQVMVVEKLPEGTQTG